MNGADSASLPLRSKQMLEPPRDGTPLVQLVVPLDGTPLSGLQYAYVSLYIHGRIFHCAYIADGRGSPATAPDDTLRLRLEAKLRKPDPLYGAV